MGTVSKTQKNLHVEPPGQREWGEYRRWINYFRSSGLADNPLPHLNYLIDTAKATQDAARKRKHWQEASRNAISLACLHLIKDDFNRYGDRIFHPPTKQETNYAL